MIYNERRIDHFVSNIVDGNLLHLSYRIPHACLVGSEKYLEHAKAAAVNELYYRAAVAANERHGDVVAWKEITAPGGEFLEANLSLVIMDECEFRTRIKQAIIDSIKENRTLGFMADPL